MIARSACITGVPLAAMVLTLASGCETGNIPTRHWRMCLVDAENNVVLLDTTSDALFLWKQPSVETLFRARCECRFAGHNQATGRVVTVETEGQDECVRVYDPPDALIAEYCVERRERWLDPLQTPRLNPRGNAVAFVRNGVEVCVAELGGATNRVELIPSCAWDPPNDPPERALRWADSFWLDDARLALGFGTEIFVANCDDGASALTPTNTQDLILCGVAGGSPVGISSQWGSWNLRDLSIGESLGQARSGHNYTGFGSLSPCGEFILYYLPDDLFRPPSYNVHHLATGRRAKLNIPTTWKIGSWEEVDLNESAGTDNRKTK